MACVSMGVLCENPSVRWVSVRLLRAGCAAGDESAV